MLAGNFEDDPTLHSLIRSSKIPKEDDLRRRYSVDPFSKHNSQLRLFSVKYNIWTERFGAGPKSAYCEVRPFSCEGGPDKFIRTIQLWFRFVIRVCYLLPKYQVITLTGSLTRGRSWAASSWSGVTAPLT